MQTEPFLEDLTRRLLSYFGAVADPRHHRFTLSDINLQVMMNSYAAKERDLLSTALANLVSQGCLEAASATSYELTDEGMRRVRIVRAAVDYAA
jgi:DNA-binding transcriptional regulator PaaX